MALLCFAASAQGQPIARQSLQEENDTIQEANMQKYNIDFIMCYPSRSTQVFINLLTHAIKFTRAEINRQITIKYGATLSNPRDTFSSKLNWAPNQKKWKILP